MRKSFLMLMTLILSISCFGVYQYNVVETGHYANQYINSYHEGFFGNYFGGSIIGESGTYKFYLTDKITNPHSMNGNTDILSKVLLDFGYVDKTGNNISWTGNTVVANEYKSIFSANPNKTIVQTAYEIGSFNPGEEIKLWLQNTKGDISYSDVPIWNKVQGGYGLGGIDIFGTELAKTNFYNSKSAYYGFAQSLERSDNSGTPTGQPLPGVLSTLLISGGVLGVFKLKRKRKCS